MTGNSHPLKAIILSAGLALFGQGAAKAQTTPSSAPERVLTDVTWKGSIECGAGWVASATAQFVVQDHIGMPPFSLTLGKPYPEDFSVIVDPRALKTDKARNLAYANMSHIGFAFERVATGICHPDTTFLARIQNLMSGQDWRDLAPKDGKFKAILNVVPQ